MDGDRVMDLFGKRLILSFFCTPAALDELLLKFPNFPSLSYQAVNKKGEHFQNVTTVSAVTWGAFPNSEIKQPTIVDPEIFLRFWKDEAFALWHSQWACLYDEESVSRQLIATITETYFLVNIVDNDFTKPGQIFEVFGLSLPEQNEILK